MHNEFNLENAVSNDYEKHKKYTHRNNLRATSFIFPLIITKMRPSSFKIISWAKNWKSQPYFNQLNMFATCSAIKVSMAPTKDSNKNGNFQKNNFLPQNELFSQYQEISLFNENSTLSQQNHANSIFFRVKSTQIWPEKEANPLRG